MTLGNRAGVALAASLWLALGPVAFGQGPVTEASDAAEAARLLEAATNLPQILAQGPSSGNADGAGAALETERLRLVDVLRNEGYLLAEIALQRSEGRRAEAARLQVKVDAGPRHSIRSVAVTTSPEVPGEVLAELQSAATATIGVNADAAARSALSRRLLWILGEHGYPFARIAEMDAVPLDASAAAGLSVRMDPAHRSRFVTADLAEVDAALRDQVAPLVPFAAGDLFAVGDLAAFRQRLSEVEGAESVRVDVVAEGDGGFSLGVRAKRSHALLPQTLESTLGFGLLLASLGILGVRQAAVSGRFGKLPVRVLSLAAGALLVTAALPLAGRALSLV